jgi:hypothetical protein
VEVVKEHIHSAGTAVLRVESFETRPPLTQEDENQELPFDTPVVPFHFASPEDPAPRQGFEWVGDEIVKIKVRLLQQCWRRWGVPRVACCVPALLL